MVTYSSRCGLVAAPPSPISVFMPPIRMAEGSRPPGVGGGRPIASALL